MCRGLQNKLNFMKIFENINNFGEKCKFKCGENRNHGKFKIYFLMVEL